LAIVHSPISCALACRGNGARETLRSRRRNRGEGGWLPPDSEVVSPNPARGELDSASLHSVLRANLPGMSKPAIVWEAMNTSTRRLSRGEWRERATKECSRYPGDPSRSLRPWVGRRQRSWESHNPSSLRRRKSDRPIVAMMRGNARGAKGPLRYRVFNQKEAPLER
jgi:hypothetical protein